MLRVKINFCTLPPEDLDTSKHARRPSQCDLAMLQVHKNIELIPNAELIYSRKSNWRYLLK